MKYIDIGKISSNLSNDTNDLGVIFYRGNELIVSKKFFNSHKI